jgi:hypothetical protein
MVREVTQGWRIRHSSEVDTQFVGVVGQGVGDRDREVSGVTFVARWADVGEADGGGTADG